MNKYKKMPDLTFDNYLLRTLKLKDAKDMLLYAKDPLVTKYLTWDNFYTVKEAKSTIKSVFFPRLKRGLPIGYAIVDQTKNLMIGTIDFHQLNKEQKEAEIGYVLNRDYWQKGIMTKALKEVISVGFEYLDYNSIIIKHDINNIGSEKVILKNNFTYVKNETMKKNEQDIILKKYRMTKEQYYGNK